MQTSNSSGENAGRRSAGLTFAPKRTAEHLPKNDAPQVVPANDLQIIGGKLQGRKLQAAASPKILPTPERVREQLFAVLGERVIFARFLDIGAGAGGVGIEAISRGAVLGSFVERGAKMCSLIKANLDKLEIPTPGRAEIFNLEAAPFLIRMRKRSRRWDIVYYALPESDDETMQLLARGFGLKVAGGILIVEHSASEDFPPQLGVLTRFKVVREGATILTFFERGK